MLRISAGGTRRPARGTKGPRVAERASRRLQSLAHSVNYQVLSQSLLVCVVVAVLARLCCRQVDAGFAWLIDPGRCRYKIHVQIGHDGAAANQ